VSDAPEIIDAAAIFQRFPDTWDTIYQYIKKLEQENDALNEAVESLRTTLWGTEAELEKANKQIDGLFAELASTGADELREYRAENHQISQKASKLCYDLIAKERELEKANAALDWLNTHCMSADPIMGRSTYRWTIEHDEPDIRAAISKAVA
jgi:chromosome segregation ATPase